MSTLDAFLLGLIQGLTEFLPISSSGHLLLFERLGLGVQSLLFNVLLHAGSLLAVIVVFFKPLINLFAHPLQKKVLLLALASIPTVCIALLLRFFLPNVLLGDFLATGFMLTACLLATTVLIKKRQSNSLNKTNSLLTGVMQGVAVIPGVSRSGATLTILLVSGVDKEEAFEFSFLLSVPIIVGSVLFECINPQMSAHDIGLAQIFVGMISAFAFGLVALLFLRKLLTKYSLLPFAAYTALISILTLVLDSLGL